MGFVDTLKEFVGFGEIEDFEEEEFETEAEVEETPVQSVMKKSKVVPMHANANVAKIVILKPKCFANACEVANELKQRRPVVFDVGGLDPDEARRVVDFVAGTVYGQDGNMEKVSGGIFLATPAHMDILGEILKSDSDRSGWSVF